MASTLIRSLESRFSKYLNPTDPEFDPLPAVACLLSPDVAKVLLTEDIELLLIAAKKHIPVLYSAQQHSTVMFTADQLQGLTNRLLRWLRQMQMANPH